MTTQSHGMGSFFNERINTALRAMVDVGPQLQSETMWPHSFIPSSCVHHLCDVFDITLEELGQRLLPLAAAFAQAPVSSFYVGAVAFDRAGNAYLGANYEFSHTHVAQSVHAEQSAIAHAWSRGATDLALLVISHAPCGHCRQFINEVNLTDDFSIGLPSQTSQPLSFFLPNPFGPDDLQITSRILNSGAVPESDSDHGALADVAVVAAQCSHAPYSGCKSAIALEFEGGQRVLGLYAENAAFNPSLPALQMAISVSRLQGLTLSSLVSVAMAEVAGALSQRENTRQLLTALTADRMIRSDITFDYYPA